MELRCIVGFISVLRRLPDLGIRSEQNTSEMLMQATGHCPLLEAQNNLG